MVISNIKLRLASLLVVAATFTATGCANGSSHGGSNGTTTLSGNWQFTLQSPTDQSFVGGLQGGFLLQKNGSISGSAAYALSQLPQSGGTPVVCSGGSAPITGKIDGQNVTLTAVAGSQTFALTGTLSADASTMTGTYTLSADTSSGSSPCGTAQTGLNWTAMLVPPLTGSIQGVFHSTALTLADQVFAVTGSVAQGENIGASTATVTGTLSFIDPVSLLSNYPCLATASLNGQISGNTVVLQIIGIDGLNAGQIGIQPSQVNQGGSGFYPVTLDSTPSGYVLHSTGTGYLVNTKACPSGSSVNLVDTGNICLALGTSKACQAPVTLTPSFLNFPPQLLGSAPTTQTVTVAYNDASGAPLTGLTLDWVAEFGLGSETGQTSFNGQPNFTLADTVPGDPCNVPIGSTFSLGPGQSCTLTVTFAPQQSCTWLPNQGGSPPAQCPLPLTAVLKVVSPTSPDNDPAFRIPITGTGLSALAPSTPELDFGASAVGEASLPQVATFTNSSGQPVQILPGAPCVSSAVGQFFTLPHPLMLGSSVAGVQVVSDVRQDVGNSTIDYSCDSDPTPPNSPNFRIVADTCSGTLLASQATCSLQIALEPQPLYASLNGLDYFLELNTVQCVAGSVESNCEWDGGRFPVELRANPPSPLRMSPGAGLDFGSQQVGTSSAKQTITLFNDPNDPNAGGVNFVGKFTAKGDYSESDDCPFSLTAGSSCTVTVAFKPKSATFIPGSITIVYNSALVQTIYLRGTGK
jgi:hypothetical protein